MGVTIFRQRLTEAIAKTGKSPDAIAAEAKISHYAIYSWLRGNCRTPNMVTLSSVADVLGVSLDWLWGRAGSAEYFCKTCGVPMIEPGGMCYMCRIKHEDRSETWSINWIRSK